MDVIHNSVPERLLYRIKTVRNGELWRVRKIMTEYPFDFDDFFYEHEVIKALHIKILRRGAT